MCPDAARFNRSYYVTLQLGSQKESLNTIIDTGSDLLWVRCTGCANCPPDTRLAQEGVLQGNIISHCLGGEDGGGFITFGAPPMADSSMQFVPMGNDTTVYNVTIFGIQVNGMDLQIPAGTFSGTGGIIDSGSTALTLPEAAYTPLREAVGSL
ncbi:unnamed protein product [Closterium sp. NIES-65]|nr:unnamed protein product [Closterium sp. NIES-65]CAI5960052.1 unnamed protein product [Closterium sp. NIES-65]